MGPRADLDGCGKCKPPPGLRSPDRPVRNQPEDGQDIWSKHAGALSNYVGLCRCCDVFRPLYNMGLSSGSSYRTTEKIHKSTKKTNIGSPEVSPRSPI